ncbi:DUF7144 family membrane protein [Streptomyces sp. BE303]|uniref:DUF7144 family membrane protein n=1 Tax=Streptomyces sp. BE303 TaxID=3002528 RepID=UPI002E776A68|nr:hypothetical protein [Streptomyces sp. BE303]MED7952345.1 hypothetical protein [Streptomyces sp. BE303]
MSAPTGTVHAGHSGSSGFAGGLTAFAAVMLLLAGALSIFRGIMAIAEDDVFVQTPNYVFKFDLTSWGWIHLILGVIAICIGLGLFRASLWARILGVALAVLLIIANFLSIPYYPVWSITVIAISAFVIWGLCAVHRDHGGPVV